MSDINLKQIFDNSYDCYTEASINTNGDIQAVKHQAMTKAKFIEVVTKLLQEQANGVDTSDSGLHLQRVSGSLPSDEELQKVVARIAYEQHGEDQAEDCYAKMGILHEFVKTCVDSGNGR